MGHIGKSYPRQGASGLPLAPGEQRLLFARAPRSAGRRLARALVALTLLGGFIVAVWP